MHLLSAACSGKQVCNYAVKSDALLDIQPCGDLTAYLEVDYECIHGKFKIRALVLSNSYVYGLGFLYA